MIKMEQFSFHAEISHQTMLEPDCTPEQYHAYLEENTGISQLMPDFAGALNRGIPEKAAAHTVLAYRDITEKESHLMPISDLKSIIHHAEYWYNKGGKPWFDLLKSKDLVEKSADGTSPAESSLLIRDCDTFDQFIINVLPKIVATLEEDPKAFIKIFPQSKKVAAFNAEHQTLEDGSTVFRVEFFADAYTPREGNGGENEVAKLKNVNKEQRIVRVSIHYDKFGNPTVFLKPPTHFDESGKPSVMPLQVPPFKAEWQDLFQELHIANNGDNIVSSGNPYYLLANIFNNSDMKQVLEKFDKIRSQLGYCDLILSGMIGPDSVFGMDIDILTGAGFKSSADYITQMKARDYKPHHDINQILSSAKHAKIFDERDSSIIGKIHTFNQVRAQVFKEIESSGRIWLSGINTLINMLDNATLEPAIHTPWLKLRDLTISRREKSIIRSIIESLNAWSSKPPIIIDGQQLIIDGKSQHGPSEEELLRIASNGQSDSVQPSRSFIKPKSDDVRNAIDNANTDPYLVGDIIVADVV